jgi:redox-sensitive bicupin YhaK (pirin superfamily)
MIIRRSHERGLTEIGWLTSRHSFSFGEYFHPNWMGFRSLRVINDDWVSAGRGFGMHGHRDMEIITLVLEGELEHQDSLGHREVLRPGEVQVMSAGSGIRHSEYNPSQHHPAHFLQIWIEPLQKGIAARYEQRLFPLTQCRNDWVLLAGPGNRARERGAFEIVQNVEVLYGVVEHEGSVSFEVPPHGAVWLHLITGDVLLDGTTLKTGDAAAIESGGTLECSGIAPRSEMLLFAFL